MEPLLRNNTSQLPLMPSTRASKGSTRTSMTRIEPEERTREEWSNREERSTTEQSTDQPEWIDVEEDQEVPDAEKLRQQERMKQGIDLRRVVFVEQISGFLVVVLSLFVQGSTLHYQYCGDNNATDIEASRLAISVIQILLQTFLCITSTIRLIRRIYTLSMRLAADL